MAAPSMLHVAPIGKTKRVTRLSIFTLDSQHSIVVGNVAALKMTKKKEKQYI
jgi:hypothetical protein